jgi:hypothetical protein
VLDEQCADRDPPTSPPTASRPTTSTGVSDGARARVYGVIFSMPRTAHANVFAHEPRVWRLGMSLSYAVGSMRLLVSTSPSFG